MVKWSFTICKLILTYKVLLLTQSLIIKWHHSCFVEHSVTPVSWLIPGCTKVISLFGVIGDCSVSQWEDILGRDCGDASLAAYCNLGAKNIQYVVHSARLNIFSALFLAEMDFHYYSQYREKVKI